MMHWQPSVRMSLRRNCRKVSEASKHQLRCTCEQTPCRIDVATGTCPTFGATQEQELMLVVSMISGTRYPTGDVSRSVHTSHLCLHAKDGIKLMQRLATSTTHPLRQCINRQTASLLRYADSERFQPTAPQLMQNRVITSPREDHAAKCSMLDSNAGLTERSWDGLTYLSDSAIANLRSEYAIIILYPNGPSVRTTSPGVSPDARARLLRQTSWWTKVQ